MNKTQQRMTTFFSTRRGVSEVAFLSLIFQEEGKMIEKRRGKNRNI